MLRLLPGNVVTRADKAEGIGDSAGLSEVLHGLGPLYGQVGVEEFGEVLLCGLLAFFLCSELGSNAGQLAGVQPEAGASGALVDQDPAFHAVKWRIIISS